MPGRAPIVWVPKAPPGLDISAAGRWGQVIRVFSANVRPYDVREQEEAFETAVLPAAHGDDFVLVVGPRGALCTFTTLWVRRFEHINLLVWSSKVHGYIVRRVPSG